MRSVTDLKGCNFFLGIVLQQLLGLYVIMNKRNGEKVPTFRDDFNNVVFPNTQFSSITCLVVVQCSAFRQLLCRPLWREFIWRWGRERLLLPVSTTTTTSSSSSPSSASAATAMMRCDHNSFSLISMFIRQKRSGGRPGCGN